MAVIDGRFKGEADGATIAETGPRIALISWGSSMR